MKDCKTLRITSGLTQEGLKKLTGIPVRTIQNWEAGKSQPPPYVLFLLEQYLRGLNYEAK